VHLLHNQSLGKDIAFLHPGDYHATGEDILISTVLGSCVSVVFWDAGRKQGGMNHFMLPGKPRQVFYLDENGKYGMQAMELLLNALLKIGSARKDLIAKVFGGAMVLVTDRSEELSISRANIQFAYNYLEVEKIRIVSADVGGNQARKIVLDPVSGKVMLKRLPHIRDREVRSEESGFLDRIKHQKEGGTFIPFTGE
jgi:chemotaxis protein CheD